MNVFSYWRTEKNYIAPSHKKIVGMIASAAEAAGLNDSNCHALCVSFLSSRRMAEINSDFLGHEGDTDVISFDYRTGKSNDDSLDPDDPDVEIFVCPAVAYREALKRKLPYSREIALYVAHGFLHAAGYDDLKPELKRKMRRAEKRVLKMMDEKASIPEMRVK